METRKHFETNQMVTSLIPTQHNLAKAFVAVNKVLHYQLLFLVRALSQVDTPTRRDVARLSRDRKTISRPFRLIAADVAQLALKIFQSQLDGYLVS
ncbi:hypothetical protein XmelCFBP4644_03070 [Xanthomonas melonis]|uniref:Uncharacterized protein n=1 Tax=Xanthomonas melonis TaxID=56456 RepID=A0A2S7DM46_9XANT|nr:hypothetical protein XmelCFBP4644_03070 [Xanthomonas melonis]